MAAQILVPYNTPADPAAFDRYYRETHTPLEGDPRCVGHAQRRANRTPQGAASPYYQIAILASDSIDALQAGLGSPEGQARAADLRNFAQAGVTLLISEMREA